MTNPERTVSSLIIGAGPTGLGAGYRLRELGERNFLIVERSDRAGGLASSFVDPAGFTWDIGGHVQFSHYEYFDRMTEQVLPAEQWLHHERSAWIRTGSSWVPYPFQNNLRFLPREQLWPCLEGLLTAALDRGKPAPHSFADWIAATFGRGIAETFMYPYNFKVWAHPASEMSHEWISERVAVPNPIRAVENVVFARTDAAWGPNATFRFPLKGGSGGLWSAVAGTLAPDRLRLNVEVSAIDPAERIAELSDGTSVRYEHLLSTMPLDRFCARVKGLSEAALAAARRLTHTATHVVGIGCRGSLPEILKDKSWIYFPDEAAPFYRVTVFSRYSPHNVPASGGPFCSLMCEASESQHRPISASTLVERTIDALRREGLLHDSAGIISRWHHRTEYGYPVPTLDREALLGAVLPELEALGIQSRGRFGGWRYEVSNQDHTFMQGVEWADRIVRGEKERTFIVPPPPRS